MTFLISKAHFELTGYFLAIRVIPGSEISCFLPEPNLRQLRRSRQNPIATVTTTFTQILYQMVFGSKDYEPFLSSENENILYAYISGILKNKDCHSYIVGGCSNHIHIISHVHPTLAPAYLIKDIKKASHKMMSESNLFPRFSGWQVGYGLFTYHISSKKNLINYVVNQKEHHKTITYKDELISLLQEHFIDYKEEYLLS